MTSKHFNWHKEWRREGIRLIHTSGAQFTMVRGDGYTDFRVAPETLSEFQKHEIARGVPVHDLAKRLTRLAREASEWHERNPID